MALSDLIREEILSRGHTLETVDDHRARGVDDQIWVRRFADAGGQAIVGGDAAMLKRPHEVVAIAETGLILIVLDERWPRQKKHVQLAYLFMWWPAIEKILGKATKGQCFKVPWGWSGDAADIKPAKIDAQDAYKKMKRRG